MKAGRVWCGGSDLPAFLGPDGRIFNFFNIFLSEADISYMLLELLSTHFPIFFIILSFKLSKK